MSGLGRTILLVEDNEDDVFIFERALKDARIGNPVRVAPHGKHAIDYLSGTGPFEDRERFPMPFITFLDLKLPYVGGFDVLRWIRKQDALEHVVVIALTSSDEERDHKTAYELGARSYIVKPPDPAQLLQLFRSLDAYWARFGPTGPLVELP
jgi:CheY-like chemotaxis protein